MGVLGRIKSSLLAVPEARSLKYDRWIAEDQPKDPRAQILFSVLTSAGINANGKLKAYEFFPEFCGELRRLGLKTHFCSSHRELSRRMRWDGPTVLVHVFGEDNFDLRSERLTKIEGRSVAVFNSAPVGALLADKLASQEKLTDFGVPMPRLNPTGGVGVERKRTGSGSATSLVEGLGVAARHDGPDSILTEFIDTTISFEGNEYYTSLRLMCVDDEIVSVIPRARIKDGSSVSVHNGDTPLIPELFKFIYSTQGLPNMDRLSEIAVNSYRCLGHGFYAHDVLVARDGSIYVCESGFKFDNAAFRSYIRPIASDVPCFESLFPVERYAREIARAFERKLSLLEGIGLRRPH